MSNWIIETALKMALKVIVALSSELLKKGEELLEKSTPSMVRHVLAQALMKLADKASALVQKAYNYFSKTKSWVGKEVATSAREIVDKLHKMAEKLMDDSTSGVLEEEATHDATVLALRYEVDAKAMIRWVDIVGHHVGEVEVLLNEHAELKGGEAGAN